MKNTIFGEVKFNIGWETNAIIRLFGQKFNIVVNASAYFDKDGITPEQENAFSDFKKNTEQRLKTIEILLQRLESDKPLERFTPSLLLFQRDGGYALLLDDKEDVDGGIAACLAPKAEVVSQDEYL